MSKCAFTILLKTSAHPNDPLTSSSRPQLIGSDITSPHLTCINQSNYRLEMPIRHVLIMFWSSPEHNNNSLFVKRTIHIKMFLSALTCPLKYKYITYQNNTLLIKILRKKKSFKSRFEWVNSWTGANMSWKFVPLDRCYDAKTFIPISLELASWYF